MGFLAPYRKTVAALVVGVIGWAGVVVTSEPSHITASEWLQLAVAAATALGVYAVANEPVVDVAHNDRGQLEWPDDGQTDLLYVLKCLTLILVIIALAVWLF